VLSNLSNWPKTTWQYYKVDTRPFVAGRSAISPFLGGSSHMTCILSCEMHSRRIPDHVTWLIHLTCIRDAFQKEMHSRSSHMTWHVRHIPDVTSGMRLTCFFLTCDVSLMNESGAVETPCEVKESDVLCLYEITVSCLYEIIITPSRSMK